MSGAVSVLAFFIRSGRIQWPIVIPPMIVRRASAQRSYC
jgi:hypothetical protein